MAPQGHRRTQRQRTLKDMSKWNNEDGTALSEQQQKKDLEEKLHEIPGYEFIEALVSASPSKTSALYKKTVALLDQLDAQAEDNDDPFHATFSGWHPSSSINIGYQDELKAFATLWKRLQQVSSVPEVTLCARKACLCAAAEHIHATLLSEGLVDLMGPDQLFMPDQKEQDEDKREDLRMELVPDAIDGDEIAEILPLKIEGSKKNKRRKLNSGGDSVTKSTFMANIPVPDVPENEDPIPVDHAQPTVSTISTIPSIGVSMASNGNTKTLCHHLSDHHGRTVARFFALLKEKRASKMEITEEELRKAAGTVPIKRKDGQNSRKKARGIDEILRRVAQKYES
ncbi:hypothetical protein BT69DRAFT_1299555 [Atractiella rhizophila]|nr:hypothetical protein BT69DRAFT_1299555 [Atractiella rhizophila]